MCGIYDSNCRDKYMHCSNTAYQKEILRVYRHSISLVISARSIENIFIDAIDRRLTTIEAILIYWLLIILMHILTNRNESPACCYWHTMASCGFNCFSMGEYDERHLNGAIAPVEEK